jgi:3-deoxy-D-arabino-heptulosonate 7-phosphate (DAHP) synthase
MVKVHHDPDNAYSDGAQSLTLDQFSSMMQEIKALESALL